MKIIANKKIVFLFIVTVMVAITIGVSIAYFTKRTETLENSVTVGKVETKLTEPNWDPDKASNIEPNKEITKDPRIENTGTNPAYVYIEVKVPKDEVTLVLDGELLSNKQNTELFTYTINDDWEQISFDDTAQDYTTRVYAYTEGALSPGSATSSLFDKIKFKNVLEGELDTSKDYIIKVTSYAIQSNTIKLEGSTDKDKMIYAYENYLKGAANNG